VLVSVVSTLAGGALSDDSVLKLCLWTGIRECWRQR